MDSIAYSAQKTGALKALYEKYGFKALARLLVNEKEEKKETPKILKNTKTIRKDFLEKFTQNENFSKDKVFLVYRIKNKITGCMYFGSTVDPMNRWKTHVRTLVDGTHSNWRIRRDVIDFGLDAFDFKVISRLTNIEAMKDKEQLFLRAYFGRSNCYNSRAMVRDVDESNGFFLISAENKKLIKNYEKKESKPARSTSNAGERGRGWYLSVHAAAKDLGFSKNFILSVLNNESKDCFGWKFKSEIICHNLVL